MLFKLFRYTYFKGSCITSDLASQLQAWSKYFQEAPCLIQGIASSCARSIGSCARKSSFAASHAKAADCVSKPLPLGVQSLKQGLLQLPKYLITVPEHSELHSEQQILQRCTGQLQLAPNQVGWDEDRDGRLSSSSRFFFRKVVREKFLKWGGSIVEAEGSNWLERIW